MIKQYLLVGALSFLVAATAHAQQAPESLVDKGACPFECCSYGKWKATKASMLRSAPSARAPQIGTIKARETVTALTGEAHVKPSQFVVRSAHGRYKPGEVLWVYTYAGEGRFKVWFSGKMYDEDLGFRPYGGSPGSRCENASQCWGTLQSNIQSVWWVELRTKEGKVGWTDETANFTGKDRCG